MKVVAYSIKPFEKEFLAKANKKKHEITLIANPLGLETIAYAEGKDAVVVFANDDVSAPVVNKLADMGIKYIATRSAGTDHFDKEAAAERGISLANVPVYSSQAIAEHAVALALSLNRHIIEAHEHGQQFDFKLNGLIGFNFFGKTVGLIGLGHIGQAIAAIYNGFGCRVIGYDIAMPDGLIDIESLSLDEVLRQSDIISLHLPLTPATKYIINAASIAIMKNGVMLINTSRGGLLNTIDALEALEQGKIGYLGMDVYEHEKGLFFEDHQQDLNKDSLLQKLMTHDNVIITPHQAFLTSEALQQMADETIKNLDLWQKDRFVLSEII
ncbi:2-hydroxyacid dehydrogenase [Adhaeribacter rhizoryzae]|uniref:2-hydroxyacid dehydrogenase n=1 Tax=Adhaeribacter rhizoryzae TaxID=2607907 RepID=A0A5M6CV74_9BACT|nr:2-hydroxyacid dehydrogenase [Adhaeribacter rhizoryzae]KAA5538953.1 2-hydroxyacid dehydrogenase [Adhaeribacter rhizoryzae]